MRARTPDELTRVMARCFPDLPDDPAKALRLRPDDVVVTPFSKCGTTWLQQICHGLRTGGSMDFDEISRVVPWIETCHQLGWNPDAPQVAEPRVFKSHAPAHEVAPGGRYIVAFREPEAAFLSLYRFFEGWFFEPGSIDIDQFFAWRCPPGRTATVGYWCHLVSWWRRGDDEDVLLLCYEDMLAEPEATVRRVATFMGIEADDALVERVVHQSSREFMLEHASHFDERYLRRYGEQHAGLPAGGESHKVTAGNRGHVQLSDPVRAGLADRWAAHVTPATGLADYAALRKALAGDG